MGERHDTSCECDQKKGTDICENRKRDGKRVKTRFKKIQNPVVALVPGSREQIHKAFDVFTRERMQEVTYVLDPPVAAIQKGQGTIVCKGTEGDVANIAADGSMEITIFLLGAAAGKMFGHMHRRNLTRSSWAIDCVTERDFLDSFDGKRVANTDVGS